MQKHKFFLTFLFLFLTGAIFIFHVAQVKKDIFTKFNGSYWTQRYNQSQWVVPNSKNSIGDDGLYMYAGYSYMMGSDPSLLNAELPPLGKYLVGLFEITTGYTGTFSLFFTALSLILFFFVSKFLLKSSLWASVSCFLLAIDPLFIAQIRAAYLDTLYLSVFLGIVLSYFYKKYYLVAILTGCFMAVKSPFLVVLVYIALLGGMWLRKEFRVKRVAIMIAVTVVVYLATYLQTFLHGHDFIYFLKVQKYILHFYSVGAKGVIGAVYPMLLTGTWYTWFSPVQHVAEWSLLWGIAFLESIIGIVLSVINRKKEKEWLFVSIWLVVYFAFLTITPIFARYLLLALPFLYNLSIWVFLKSTVHNSLFSSYFS
ncbi:MAG TPA: hypothetical protein VF820_05570 [Patescibacteria group bacterium]